MDSGTSVYLGILQNSPEHLFCRTSVNKYIGSVTSSNPENIHLFKVNNKNRRKRCEICSKLAIKTSEGSRCLCS